MLSRNREGLISKPYRLYKYNVYPRIESFRGSYRILKLLENLAQIKLDKVDSKPESIFKKNWDNLLILDACRYDFYKDIRPSSDFRISLGSNSREFIERTFSEGEYDNIVYVTGNPHFTQIYSRI